jgi:hypothetical protein
MNQDPKDQKPLSDEELEKAAGGADLSAAEVESGGGAGTGATPSGTPSTGDIDPGLAASGMDPETYYAIFPASRPLPNQGPQ